VTLEKALAVDPPWLAPLEGKWSVVPDEQSAPSPEAQSLRDETISSLFDEHYRGLCRLAGLLLGDSAGAEEVVQEAFLRTFSGWWRVRQPERAQWYLRKSVVNLCRSKMRRRVTEDRGNRVTWADSRDEAGGVDAGSDDGMILAELVRRLPPRQRDAVILRYYEDLPEAEIARVLGCAVGTVKSQLAKARNTLARGLENSGLEPPKESNSSA
jgi:RNA polymerase sigma-70 factor (sigma-E family)